MPAALTFGEILEAADALPLEEQAELGQIHSRRADDAKRQALVARVRESQEEFRQGRTVSLTPEEFAAELAK